MTTDARRVTTGARRSAGIALVAACPSACSCSRPLLRLPDLATRGTWDADQGHDMLMLRALVRDGVVPLLGPPTSIGDVHHGALYYYLLVPGRVPDRRRLAARGRGAHRAGRDRRRRSSRGGWPRSIGGPVAGLVAGLAMAVSTVRGRRVDVHLEPEPHRPVERDRAGRCVAGLDDAAIRAGGCWPASGRRSRCSATCWASRCCRSSGPCSSRTPGRGPARRAPAGLALRARRRLAIVALRFVPLAVHELTTDFSEVNAALDYLRAGGDATALGPLGRFLVIARPRRVVAADRPAHRRADRRRCSRRPWSSRSSSWRARAGDRRGSGRRPAGWVSGCSGRPGSLTFASPSLATVVPGLPNDHYHAFADPMVFTLVGLGAAVLWRGRLAGVAAGPQSGAAAPSRSTAGPSDDAHRIGRSWPVGSWLSSGSSRLSPSAC